MIAGFEFGMRERLLVRRETVAAGASTASARPWRLLHASDLHLTARRRPLVAELLTRLAEERPDVLVLGGDLLERSDGAAVLREFIGEACSIAPVAAIDGNHDRWCGVAAVRAAVLEGGGAWLPDEPRELRRDGARPLRLQPALPLHAMPGRSDAVTVAVAHHPAEALPAAAARADLVLAGHLHGGQCVLWRRGAKLYPGALFSRWNGLRFELGATTLLVSRGVADTLPLRFRCPREVITCAIG